MKNRTLSFIFLLIVSMTTSCSSEDELNYQSELGKSKSAWLNFKKSSNNSYKYTVINGSWSGFSWETEITVKNGIVTQRAFKYASIEGLSTNIPQGELQWNETESQIGTHKNGAKPMTLDNIYSLAKQNWLAKEGNVKTYFETKNNGMISICGYVENSCTDDCFTGIKITRIKTI